MNFNKKVFLILIMTLTILLISCTKINDKPIDKVSTEPVEEELYVIEKNNSKTENQSSTVEEEIDAVEERSSEVKTNENETPEKVESVDTNDDTGAIISESDNTIALTYENIYWLQESLKMAGHYTALDGQWGPNTKNALKEFKKEKGLSNIEIFDEETKALLTDIREEQMIKDPSSDVVLLNKTNYLSSLYVPNNLVEADLPKSKYMELPKHVALKAEEMFSDALEEGHGLYFASGYRSYSYQETLFSRRVANYGFEDAAKVVAIPGQSEHQTGLALDITTKEMGYGLSQSFEETEAFNWLINNCYKYGFILRYRKGKEDITGYIYEPWHYRYIGDVEMAKEIMAKEMVLEEYLNNLSESEGLNDD